MTLDEARSILEVDHTTTMQDIKIQFKWLAKFYHPDNPETGDAHEFCKVIEAFKLINNNFTN